ncbi:MAG: hypothetical protein LAO31_21365 [Acidobacteriia bacterium]|nr:hypothetical protein [Terriglobia bacterium]
MDQMEQLRAAASSLLNKAQDAPVSELASAVEKATGVQKLSSDLEKAQVELRKLELEERKLQHENETATKRDRSERIKDYVAILAPVLTMVTLAVTLIVQYRQFIRAEKDKSEAALDAQWEQTVKTISETSKLPPGIIALHPFLNSPKYGERAKLTAVQLLANSTDPVFFNDLFGAAFVPVDWSNLEFVLKLDRALGTRGGPLISKSWNPKTQTNDRKRLNPQEVMVLDYFSSVAPRISAQVGSVLKTPRPNGSTVDLSATYFRNADWRGVDLSGDNIENMWLAWMGLKDANLDKITQFRGAVFFHVTWWEAKSVSPELLEYLATNYGCIPGAEYGPDGDKFTPQQCADALDRLRHKTP